MKTNEIVQPQRSSKQVPVKIIIEPVYIGLIEAEEIFMEVLYQYILKKLA